ncbi:C3a anaphylatoxin chemotactic receptor-like [Poecilia formosa]|uniref:C3a anaphylatoxin chemotactic receptor-like n=1 Tax=Poecilia formosa TaxID=48698 RepID=A0A096M3U8_POEFO|nr:PREDICTED: C3a anaphylatoxin chemotactic receptor-like [Poecilia formosa]XP_007564393.1 PREDICTED: C3a anaphylatoxin chemotactic receptor-like [Poecilia formosa]
MFASTSLPPSSKDNHNNVDAEAIMENINTVLLTLTVVFGLTGNSVVIWVAGFKLKPKVTNVWLVNLAIADLIFCVTRVFSLIKKLFFDHWPFGEYFCRFHGFFKYANMFCSVFLLAVISLDRMVGVWRPFFTKQRRTLYAARVVAVCVWITAILFSSPYLFYRQVNMGENNMSKCSFEVKESKGGGSSLRHALYLNRFLCGFVFPFMVILICYIMAAIGIRRTRLVGKTRPLRILASLVIAFFLCWGPYHCLLLVKMVDKHNAVLKIWHPLANGFAYFNSCVNPLLYFFMGLDFKPELRWSLTGICKKALTDTDTEEQVNQSDD